MSGATGGRRGLRPDTFPFLAVLLCAMGSLILLLLVMDRRAKAVARAKLHQAAARAAEDDAQARIARREEWERKRAALHAALLRQDEEVRLALRTTQAKAEAAAARAGVARADAQALEMRLGGARQEVVEQERMLVAEKARLALAGRETETLLAERVRLTAELEQLEHALRDLIALRQRRQQTYSVVPYHGKHGDNRRPLYVECAAIGLVFHPDRKVMSGAELAPLTIRAEVEHRLAGQMAPRSTKPYLLLLVRPDGVETFYRIQAALAGLTADFGYELIDSGWVLEFPEDEGHAAKPWKTVGRSAESGPMAAQRSAPSAGSGTRQATSSPAPVNPGSVTGHNEPVNGRGGHPTQSADSAHVITGAPEQRGMGRPGTGGAGSPAREIAIPLPIVGATTPVIPDVTGGAAGHPPPPNGTGGQGRQMAAEGRVTPEIPVAPGSGPLGSATAGQPHQELVLPRPSVGTPVPVAPGMTGHQSGTGEPRSAPATLAPPSILGETPGGAGTPRDSGQPSDQTGGSTTERRLGPDGKATSGVGTAPRRRGARDWVIAVECQTDAYLLHPGAIRVSSGDNALSVAVRQEITRRQALAPYQPHIRFLVRPDGVRMYYRAFPLLEGLGVPMSRQNLLAGEEVGLEHLTR